ncbi:inorganic phosphate transporter Pho88 [Syncephalis fuscata]|nr:inorganic phosphate transporter Pho88 [Syncephalis fuscata]
MANPMINVVMMLGIMQLTKWFDMEDPSTIFYFRILYVSVQATLCLVALAMIKKVQAKNDQTPLRYQEAQQPFSQEPPNFITTTVCEYDQQQFWQQIKQVGTSVALLGFIHYKWGYVQPLLLQSILPVKSLFDSPAIQVHLLGKPAEGELKRPWKAASPFGAFGSGAAATNPTGVDGVVDERKARRKVQRDNKSKKEE